MREFSILRRSTFALVATGLLLAGRADAQSITLPSGTSGIFRTANKGALRGVNQEPYWVNRQDCLQQDIINVPVVISGYAGYLLQVWAGDGTDCTAIGARSVPPQTTACWLLYNATPGVITSNTYNVQIPTVNIVAQIVPSASSTGGVVTSVPVPAYPDVCTSDLGTSLAVGLYFMLVDASGTVKASASMLNFSGFDISPPLPPTGVAAASGDTRVHLSWTDSTDPDIFQYNIYCDPPPGAVADAGLSTLGLSPYRPLSLFSDASGIGGALGAGGATAGGGTGGVIASGGAAGTLPGFDSGLGTVAGSDSGTIASASCAPTILTPGAYPPDAQANPTSKYNCGSVAGITATKATAEGLTNYRNYVFGVAAVDHVGNIGVLSGNACGQPVQITDFFDLYKQDGGKGGGGICSISRTRSTSRGFAALMGAFLGLGMIRRRPRRG